MSGTSADGVDVAVIDTNGKNVKVVGFDTFPYPPRLRQALLALCDPAASRIDNLCHYNFVLGEVFARSLIRFCRRSDLPLSSIDLIGSHGHTVYHQPHPRRYGRTPIRSTLQIGEPAVIAHRTGITTVADFRPADMAAGGQGAPLVPFADYLLFRRPRLCRAVQNIGGIANLTYLPAAPALENVLAFDTGPGNMVIDRIAGRISGGKYRFDRDGKMAARGTVRPEWLRQLLAHPYFRRRPPKTTGREMFGFSYADEIYRTARKRRISPTDLIATVTALTAVSIARAYRKFLPALPREMILCGGGAYNQTLIKRLRTELKNVTILSTNDFRIEIDAKEAVSFAMLAYATVKGRANNVPSATGAHQAIIMGKIVPAG